MSLCAFLIFTEW